MSVPTFLFQFKITLQEIQPAIWRRIQVPAKQSFWDLHVAIQDAMGWKECHFHHDHKHILHNHHHPGHHPYPAGERRVEPPQRLEVDG